MILFLIPFLLLVVRRRAVWGLPWHLNNTVWPGNDVNVLPVWESGVNGSGVTVCVLDDGVEFDHPDLAGSLRPDLSFDFNSRDRLPEPQSPDDVHGTRCAGQIAGRTGGKCGGSGVAPGASVSAIRLLGGRIDSSLEASALTFRNDRNDIYSCSWGPADDGKSVEGPDATVLSALVSGVLNGRGGRGSIFVFAAGNGHLGTDNCNYDGYANGAFALTIGAIGADNSVPYYMEECAAMLAVTYSSGGSHRGDKSLPKISTLAIDSSCTANHGGTSAAAPLASGLMALALSVRPELTWRDMQNLLVTTALPIDTNHSTWILNGAGRPFSTLFGFGKMDAERLVNAARVCKLKLPPILRALPWLQTNAPISSVKPVASTLHLDLDTHWDYFELADLARIERVSVSVHVRHEKRGDLIFALCSPAGTCVNLTSPRPKDEDSLQGLPGWTFSTVAFWDETEILGTWTLHINNSPGSNQTGELIKWRLSLWGESTPQAAHKYSSSQFARDFVYNYFPPSSDYFSDRHAIWSLPTTTSTASPQSPPHKFLYSQHIKEKTQRIQRNKSIRFASFILLGFAVTVLTGIIAINRYFK